MLTPGAPSSTSGPVLEKQGLPSLELVAPTAMTESQRAGKMTLSPLPLHLPEFPAAAT